jgi:hypothetical protein
MLWSQHVLTIILTNLIGTGFTFLTVPSYGFRTALPSLQVIAMALLGMAVMSIPKCEIENRDLAVSGWYGAGAVLGWLITTVGSLTMNAGMLIVNLLNTLRPSDHEFVSLEETTIDLSPTIKETVPLDNSLCVVLAYLLVVIADSL